MVSKVCKKCLIEKDLSLFRFRKERNYYDNVCKECRKEQQNQWSQNNREKVRERSRQYYLNNEDQREHKKQYQKQYYQNNKEAINLKTKQYNQDHKQELKEYKAQYYQDNKDQINLQHKQSYQNNKEERLIYAKEYREEHKEERNAWSREKYKTDPLFKLHRIISNRIWAAIKDVGNGKDDQSINQFLLQPISQIWHRIEILFSLPSNLTPDGKVWMTLDNWGIYNTYTWIDSDYSTHTWNIDHIEPHRNFNYINMECDIFRQCWDIDNLRPLSAKHNNSEQNRSPETIFLIKNDIKLFLISLESKGKL